MNETISVQYAHFITSFSNSHHPFIRFEALCGKLAHLNSFTHVNDIINIKVVIYNIWNCLLVIPKCMATPGTCPILQCVIYIDISSIDSETAFL